MPEAKGVHPVAHSYGTHRSLYLCHLPVQVAFKSDYLQLFQAQQITAAELLVAKEALSEARQV
jgi:hypothetical protein